MGLRREGRDGWRGSAAGIIHSFFSSKHRPDRQQTNARGYGTMTNGGRRGVRVDGSLGKSTHRPWFLNHPALAASLRTRVAVTDDGLETFQVDDDYFKRLRENLFIGHDCDAHGSNHNCVFRNIFSTNYPMPCETRNSAEVFKSPETLVNRRRRCRSKTTRALRSHAPPRHPRPHIAFLRTSRTHR